jgi:hypothetical protein
MAINCFSGVLFNSSSIFMAYDAYDYKNFTIKFIDFDKF